MDAPRTIRQQIMRQAQGLPLRAAVAVFPLMALGLVAFLALGRHRSAHSEAFPIAMLVPAVVLIVVMLVALRALARRQAKCPKCGTDLGVLVYLMQDTPQRKKINFCPYCAVNLDDPMPQDPTPANNVTTPDKLIWK